MIKILLLVVTVKAISRNSYSSIGIERKAFPLPQAKIPEVRNSASYKLASPLLLKFFLNCLYRY